MDSFRRITVGTDYQNGIHYQVGGRIKDFTINDIVNDGKGFYKIFIKRKDLIQEWKGFSDASVIHYELKVVDND